MAEIQQTFPWLVTDHWPVFTKHLVSQYLKIHKNGEAQLTATIKRIRMGDHWQAPDLAHMHQRRRFSGTRSKGCLAPERKIGRVAPAAEVRFSGSEKRKMAVDELADLAQHQSLTLRSASNCKNKRKPDLKSNFDSKIATQLKNHFANILPRENIFEKLEWSSLHENGSQRP